MYRVSENTLFSTLPDRRPPFKEFVLTMGVQVCALTALAWVGVLHIERIVAPEHSLHYTRLVSTPPPVIQEPAPVKVFKQPIVAAVESPKAVRIPRDAIKPKPVPVPEAPKVVVQATKTIPLPPSAPVAPRQLVKTNVFSTGSSATPTIARAPQQVQTGGFGDPNGVPATENKGGRVNIAQLGSYDLPSGPGYGNGTGGAKGVRGVVASAGFGSGTATGDSSGRINATRGTVREGGFGDTEAAAPVAKVKRLETPKVVPAEILSKPVPVYTDEARKQRIEGEVLIEVVFESSGKIRVLRVVRGLGHGLDEAAVRAAEQIRFKPALRDGQPADSNAVLHIVFQLA